MVARTTVVVIYNDYVQDKAEGICAYSFLNLVPRAYSCFFYSANSFPRVIFDEGCSLPWGRG